MFSYLTSPEEPRWTRWLLLLFVPLLILYYVAAKGNGETKNHDVTMKDQKVYLNTANRIAHDPVGYFTPRQRTPGYPYFLSLFYSKEKFDVPAGTKPPFAPGWFERGKAINLNLSVVLLAGLFLFCKWRLPLVESGIITVATGLLLFTYKAGYVQPELCYWVLNTVLFVLMAKMLIEPSWRLATVCGFLSALTYFIKAGTQPLLFLFLVTWVLKLIWDRLSYYRRRSSGRLEEGEAAPQTWSNAGQGALVIGIFMVVLVPYYSGTKERFGKPFYSVYTDYMMWLPLKDDGSNLVNKDHMWAFYGSDVRERRISVEEFNAALEKRVRKRIKKEGGKGLSEEALEARIAEENDPLVELPSASGYFQDHGVESAIGRVSAGLERTQKRLRKYYRRAMSMLTFVWKVALAGVALRLLMLLWHRFVPGRRFPVEDRKQGAPLAELLSRSPYLLFYVLGFFLGYLAVYAWYDALGIDARLVLSLYLPLLFCGVVVLRAAYDGLVIPGVVGGRPLYLGKLVNLLLIAVLCYLSIRLLGGGELYNPAISER
ncbi:MAG: hypothetical protein ACR2RV_09925 [Verrucomicrobiales bacterium]